MKINLYIHIPFCVRKCAYCDFLSGPFDERVRSLYVDALCREIAQRAAGYIEYEVAGIYFGGGTPSILESDMIERIMNTIKLNYDITPDCEISMEVNPGTLGTLQKALDIKKAGINRVSIGLQSADDDELRLLGRIHTRADFERTYKLLYEAGIQNLNVDLISSIPGQTPEKFKGTLDYVLGLEPAPAHISVYGLIVEEGTPFFELYSPGKPQEYMLPDEDTDREIYKITGDILKEAGYERYEISNYARPGMECRHNIVYWRRGDYLGLGLGASSMVDNIRWKNTSDMDRYLKMENMDEDVTILSKKEQMEEFMFLGLRMMEGISQKDFKEYFKEELPEDYRRVVEKYVASGHLKQKDDRIMLTEKGIDVSNVIFSEF